MMMAHSKGRVCGHRHNFQKAYGKQFQSAQQLSAGAALAVHQQAVMSRLASPPARAVPTCVASNRPGAA